MIGSEIFEIVDGYSSALRDAWAEENPAWAEQDGVDVFFANVASLLGELGDEMGTPVQAVAFEGDRWFATCFKCQNGWLDLAGRRIDECEVSGMVRAGAWVVFTSSEWSARPGKPH